MSSSAKGLIPHKAFNDTTREAYHYSDLAYKSLYSVGQFCDAGYEA